MKKLILLLLILGTLKSVAQVIVPEEDQETRLGRTVYGLGFAAGVGTGLGLSFRQHFPSEMSYQIVGGIIKVDAKLSYDIGVEIQFDLIRSESSRFFAAGGSAYYYSGESGNNLAGPLRIAVGVGGEFSNVRLVHVTLEGMFTYFSDGTILPLPQLSFHYYFF